MTQQENFLSLSSRILHKILGGLDERGQSSRAHIIAFCVRPEHRGRGFGRWMLTETPGNLIEENALALDSSRGFKDTTV